MTGSMKHEREINSGNALSIHEWMKDPLEGHINTSIRSDTQLKTYLE